MMEHDPFRDYVLRSQNESLALVNDGSQTNRTEWARLDALIDPECVVYVGYLGDHVVHIRRANEGEPNFHLDFTGGQILLVKLQYRRVEPPVVVSEADFILFMDEYMTISNNRNVYIFFRYGARRGPGGLVDARPLNERWLDWFLEEFPRDLRLVKRTVGGDIVQFTRLNIDAVEDARGNVAFRPANRVWSFSVRVHEDYVEVVNINNSVVGAIPVYESDIYEFLTGDRTDVEYFFRYSAANPPPSRENPFSGSSGSRNPARQLEVPPRGENPGLGDVEVVRYRNPPERRKQRREIHRYTEPESRDPQNPRWSAPSGVGNPPGTAAALLLERLMDLQLT